MSELTLFGVSKTQWDLFNGFANWFAAIGSIAAAGVALYIANRSAKPTAVPSVGHRISIGPGSTKPYPEFVAFRIVNTGDRPIRITGIGWRVGIMRKRYAVQMHDEAMSSRLPIDLTHGQEAVWYVPLAEREEPWLEYFAKGMLLPHYRIAIWSARAQFFSSIGLVFEARLEESLREKLLAAAARVANES